MAIAVTTIKAEATSNYNSNRGTSFGEILKPPPPPPPLGNILPVPFHGGRPRTQRQNLDIGYQYPPPPPPSLPPSANFKFPSPFYRQYNFNFVPPPQPFSTTPSPTMFQKVSNWLFPGEQNPHDELASLINTQPIKKGCNPCNLVPWIPVIRYDISGKQLQQTSYPTYGPPSATAVSNSAQSGYQYPVPQNQLHYESPVSGGIPHVNYGPPISYVSTPSSTYGPPSPTHTLAISSNGPPTSTHISSSTYGIPSTSYGIPSSSFGSPSSTYVNPSSTYGSPSPPVESFGADTNFRPVTPGYSSSVPNYESPQTSSAEVIRNVKPSNELTLPKLSYPTGFKNSYGEPITNTALNIFPVSATAAESTKVKTEVALPGPLRHDGTNDTFVVNKPTPFQKGRFIHTLQPVSLPNLSGSPLPPIFNAKPFRPRTQIHLHNIHNVNSLLQHTNNDNIAQKLPVNEFSHSIEYPPTIIQSPIIDFKSFNQTKGYRKIPSYSDEYSNDVSSQASEDHLAATKNNGDAHESSFESTGLEYDNQLFDKSIPLDLIKTNKVPSNHKPLFSDLRGISDELLDKYRTEENLQSIDSPLLYLKPSAPHKGFDDFVISLSTPASNGNDFEIYDDIPTTASPDFTTISEFWNNKGNDYDQELSSQKQGGGKPKVIQYIIPYSTNNNDISNSGETDWISASADESQGRKVPSQTISYTDYDTVTQSYDNTVTDSPDQTTVTDQTEPYQYNTHAILNDLYDVKEPPFDIIKLQHNIDDWTEQEYSKQHHKVSQKVRPSGKYPQAKKIPDEYFTTPNPTIFVTTEGNYNYKYNSYDYEGSSSIQHSVTDDTYAKSNREKNVRIHNSLNRQKDKSNDGKPHIYTAASSFRLTTTPAPWEKLQTSISPLTKEKIYVVTSKPWPDKHNVTTWFGGTPFESKKTSPLDNMPFKSPRFLHRPSIPSALGTMETMRADASLGFSRMWHQSSKSYF